MVRVTGLEPARLRHQNLNLARLPFRHTRINTSDIIISCVHWFVNRFSDNFSKTVDDKPGAAVYNIVG